MTKHRELEEKTFLKDIATHQLEIVRDDDIHRHLRVRRPGTYCMGFDVITYPGYLVYSGDMGCYVFARLADMFQFFRSNRGEGDLPINPHYWGEKLEAVSARGGSMGGDSYREFSNDKFCEWIDEKLAEFKSEILEAVERDDGDDDADFAQKQATALERYEELEARIKREVRGEADNGEYAVYYAMREFEHDDRSWFQDSWEVNFREYSYRFLWCCYAIVWTIRQYDAAKSKQAEQKA